MWIDIRDCSPLEDGFYNIMTVTGRRTIMQYTRKGGWNTFYTESGHLIGDDISDYVKAWYNPLLSERISKAQFIID